jgi:hypothetical protein
MKLRRPVVVSPSPDEIYIGGTRYLLAAEIARTYGYAPNYVASLCRLGKVRGCQLRGIWYIDTESFATFARGQAHNATLSPTASKDITKPTV